MASRGGSKPGRESKGEKGNKDLAVTAAAIDAAMETPLLAEEEEDELEMAKAWKAVEAVRVSADLPAAAKQLITLLRRVDQNGRLYAGPAVKDAIRRYEQCWLRMAYGQTDEVMRTLQPPLDVQWVWLVHRLNPPSVLPPSLHSPSTPPALLSQEAYAEDCSTILGRLLDGAIFDADDDDVGTYAEDCSTILGRLLDGAIFDPDDDDVGSESARGEAAATAACRALWEELFPLEPYDPPALAAPAAAAPAAGDATGNDAGDASAGGVGEEREEGSGAAEGESAAAAATGGDGGGGGGAARQGNGAAAPPDAAAAAVVPPALPPSLPSELTYDLEAAVARQSSFFYQVGTRGLGAQASSLLSPLLSLPTVPVERPWMLERQYLQGSLQRYRMFLNLVMLNRGAFLTPTYDIDLLWHAHMMCAAAYTKDSDWLLSRLLGHDDSDAMPVAAAAAAAASTSNTIDSNTRKRLEWAYRATAQLWDRTYGSPFDRAGAMFRGPAPVPIPPPPLVAPRRVLPLEGGEGEFTVAELNAGRGLEPRMTVEVDFMVWGLLNFHADKPENLFLMIRTKRAAHDFSLRTRSLPARPGCRPPAWRQRWALEAEVATAGLQFELRAESGTFWGGLWGPRIVGSGGITWEEVLSRPALLVDRQVALAPVDLLTAVGIRGDGDDAAGGNKAAGASGGADGSGGGERGGSGGAGVFMRGTDDNGAMICEEIAVQRDFRPQYGRWGSRTVYNHEDKEVFVIRKRVAKGTWHARYRPLPVEPKEKVILLHQGGWRYIETDPVPLPEPEPPHLRVGVVRGPVVAQAVPQASDDYDQIQRFCLLDCLPNGRTATVTIERRRDATIFIQGIKLTLEEEGTSRQVLLLPGRHHKYKVPGAPSVEDLGFATLIRFPPDAPHGRATALLNWKGAAMEVAPDESVPLVLLLCTCLSEAINDMAGINRVRRFRRLPLADPDPANHWGALSISRDTVGGAAAAAAAKSGEEEFSFSSVEMSRQKWWNRRPLRFAVGAGSCGAGACGPSCTGPVDIFSG
ncbi:unnamed protein product [Closterium sp. NIES-64]|nr:unnamed protein product [Closterium sp. NIES-64]